MSRAQKSLSKVTCRSCNSKALDVDTFSLLWKTVKSTSKWVYDKRLTWIPYIIDFVLKWDNPLFTFKCVNEMKIVQNLFLQSAI